MRRLTFKWKAIFYCLFYGLLPWWFYESKCHHAGLSYWGHVWLNLGHAWVWFAGKQKLGDIRFEIKVNKL